MTTADPFDLERFVTAQAPVFPAVLAELQAGRKRSHWMWFVFPQLRSRPLLDGCLLWHRLAIRGACLSRHPVLGPRLELCARTALDLESGSLRQIFGSADDTKFQSSMTLFALAAAEACSMALDRCCVGILDAQTLRLVEAGGRPVERFRVGSA